MHRTRLLRGLLLAFLVAFVLWVVTDIWRTVESDEPPAPLPASSAGPEAFPVRGAVEEEASGFQLVQERGGVVVSRLRAGKMLGVEGGSRVLSDILIEVRPDPEGAPERLLRVEGDAGRFDAAANQVELSGEVYLAIDTGESLTTDGLVYRLDQRLAAADGLVRFDLGGARGQAVGMVASLATGRVELLDEVVLDGAGSVDHPSRIRADRLRRDPGVTHLGGTVRIEGDWGAFDGRELTFNREEDGSATGVSTSPGELMSRDAASGEGFHLTADAWTFLLDADQQLRAVIARDEPRLVRLADDTDGDIHLQDIRAPEIRVDVPTAGESPMLLASGDAARPTVARFLAGPIREVRSLELRMAATDTGDGREAVFTGAVTASGDGRKATGALLRAGADRRLELWGDEADQARVIQGEHVMTARRISFLPGGGGEAEGDVEIQRPPAEPGQERFAAVSRRGSFGPDARFVRLEGDVRVWQGERTLMAGWLESDRDAGTLRAGEAVRATFRPGEGLSGLRASERVRVRADTLLWRETPQRVTFVGNVSMVQEGAQVSSDRLILEDDGPDRRLLIAEGNVIFDDPQWRGSGDRLVHSDPEGTYELESYNGLARVAGTAEAGDLTGRLLRFSRDGGAVEVVSREGGRATVRYGDGTAPQEEPRTP